MKHSLFFPAFIVVFCPLFAFCADSSNSYYSIARSTVLLSSQQGCGTGFFLTPNLLVTNAHVADFLCDKSGCENAKIHRAKEVNGEASEAIQTKISLVQKIETIDVAFFSVQNRIEGVGIPLEQPGEPKMLHAFGFPGCKTLTRSDGQTLRSGVLDIDTSIPIRFGESGGPIVNDRGELVAMVRQSSSLYDAILSRIFPDKTFHARAVPGRFLSDAQTVREADQVRWEADLLTNFYLREVQPVSGYARLTAGYRFLSLIEILRDEAVGKSLPTPDLEAVLSAGSYFSESTENEFWKTASQSVRRFSAAATLETRGIFSRRFMMLSPSLLPQEAQKLLGSDSIRGYPGFNLVMLTVGVMLLVVLFPLNILWGFSVGWMYREIEGGFLKKLFVSIFMGLFLWPFSWFGFVFARRNKSKPAVETKRELKRESKDVKIVRK